MHPNQLYTNPHPHVQPQQQQPMYQQQSFQLPANVQICNTPYGPQYVDVTTGQIVQIQQPNMNVARYPQPQQQYQGQYIQQQRGLMQPQQQQPRFVSGQPVQYGEVVDVADNRFNEPTTRQFQPQNVIQEQSQMRVPSNIPNTVTVIEEKKFVPGKKLLKSKNTTFLPRTRPFMEDEIEELHLRVLNGGFSMAVEELYDKAYESVDKNKLVVIGKCTLAEAFNDTTLKASIRDLYQSDVGEVYRFMKQVVDSLATRGDIVFVSEYNQWLTDQINDILQVLLPGGSIDSFVDDFNDLKRKLGDMKTSNPDLESIQEEITKRMRTVFLLGLELNTKKDPLVANESDTIYLVEQASIVFCKLMSTELWKDGVPDTETSGNRLMSSLADHVSDNVFYVFTLDKVVYKVVIDLQHVVKVTMIGN